MKSVRVQLNVQLTASVGFWVKTRLVLLRGDLFPVAISSGGDIYHEETGNL